MGLVEDDMQLPSRMLSLHSFGLKESISHTNDMRIAKSDHNRLTQLPSTTSVLDHLRNITRGYVHERSEVTCLIVTMINHHFAYVCFYTAPKKGNRHF